MGFVHHIIERIRTSHVKRVASLAYEAKITGKTHRIDPHDKTNRQFFFERVLELEAENKIVYNDRFQHGHECQVTPIGIYLCTDPTRNAYAHASVCDGQLKYMRYEPIKATHVVTWCGKLRKKQRWMSRGANV